MDPVHLALAHERRRAPGVDPLPLHGTRELLAPHRAQMLDAPVGHVGVELHLHLDPLRVRIVLRRSGGSGVDREDARFGRLDRTEVGHGARIPDRGRRDVMTQHTRALLAEACGTFWFFFIGAGVILTTTATGSGGLLEIALAHGIALAIAVSAFGAVSGGHFNPAV